MREWSIKIYQLNEHGEEIPASIYSKVTYHLHESFKSRAVQGMLPWRDDFSNFNANVRYAQFSLCRRSCVKRKDGASSICLSLFMRKRGRNRVSNMT